MKKHYAIYQPYYRANLRLATPVVISQLGQVLVQTADSIIAGRFVGTTALAAVSLVNSVFMMVLVIGIGIAYGLTPLIAQENGRKNYGFCAQLLSASFQINMLIGLLLFLLVFFGSVTVLNHLDQPAEVIHQAKPFLILMGASIIPLMVFNTFKQFAEGLGFTKQAMLISIWGNILNVCLGIIFVKGLFGMEPMGIRGIGFSTLIDRSVMAVIMSFYVFKSKHFEKYLSGFSFFSLDPTVGWRILKIGTPVAMQSTFEISAFSGAAILIGTLGTIQLAAHQVAINLAAITYMMASGIGAAAAIKSGHSFGAESYGDLRKSALASYHIVLLLMGCMALVFMFGNHLIPWVYTDDKNVVALTAQLLLIAALFQLFDGTQVVGLGILRGIGDVKIPAFITFLAYWVLGLPFGYLLGIKLGFGASGIWFGLTLGLMVAALLLYFRFNYLSKKLEQSKLSTLDITLAKA
ncbi:MATE family efflux transporter [Mucilaginibacter arboris]|uniref:Multidrug-efflux transporter n=1 Tax=Mucilaginibacter arboris TaxID=2682090 RepID=A0A7K1SY07_9SPHI|nr:MATE family efflux transporter [Mucilaginibacter arboris]MVN22193.1 MATE family efflux transporter [Mucilaginibacter arboris]